MSHSPVVVEGNVKADGTLELTEKLNVPAGRVQVVIQPLPDLSNAPLLQRLEAIWAGQSARGHVPRAVEDVEAGRKAIQDELEDGMQKVMRLQEDCRETREHTLMRPETRE